MPPKNRRYYRGEESTRETLKATYYDNPTPFPCGQTIISKEPGSPVVSFTPVVLKTDSKVDMVRFMRRVENPDDTSPWVIFINEQEPNLSVNHRLNELPSDDGSLSRRSLIMPDAVDEAEEVDQPESDLYIANVEVTGGTVIVHSLYPGRELVVYNKETGRAAYLAPDADGIHGLVVDFLCDLRWTENGIPGYKLGTHTTSYLPSHVIRPPEGIGLDPNSFPLILGYRSLESAREALR